MEPVQSEAQPSEVEEVCGLTRGVSIRSRDCQPPDASDGDPREYITPSLLYLSLSTCIPIVPSIVFVCV